MVVKVDAEEVTHAAFKKDFRQLTMEYFETKNADIVEVANPMVTYTEYCNSGATVPGRVVETATNEETAELIGEIAARPPPTETVSWFHVEGINDDMLRNLCDQLKLSGPNMNSSGAPGKSIKLRRDTVKMIRMKHREPSLRWFGTHMYICMQMLVRESVEDDVPVVQEQQVSFIYIPSRRMIISVCEDIGTDFEQLRDTLVTGASVCNSKGTDPTMLLALLCDKFIDDAFPLAEELGDYLELLAHSVVEKPDVMYNRACDKLRMQLWRIRRFSIRTRRLTETYLEDSLEVFQNARFKDYITVVDKQSASMDDVCAMYIDRCGNILSGIDSHLSKKNNDTLHVLTIITALMIPTQFLTGVYGMNFSVMPELNTRWGYYMFWCLVPTLWLVAYWGMKRKGFVTAEMDKTITEMLPTDLISKAYLESLVPKKLAGDIRSVGAQMGAPLLLSRAFVRKKVGLLAGGDGSGSLEGSRRSSTESGGRSSTSTPLGGRSSTSTPKASSISSHPIPSVKPPVPTFQKSLTFQNTLVPPNVVNAP
mmetsp:Transcript_23386/g.57338  ORF Transcript_23386/g.57338 Transcript_23386/m.57338 type:complete len:537 (+) Transcript_23386:110-1720(+)|eukprot:CAMPEP_0197611252 /NCGR_PEP_ID=MMETSP1326-20131121/55000_1 /TAXON_ID=1155430 /ORGANISM="Genus nov. species nov., Strain RCC2288" /LENGTH=536 /DNA_ID=CAMNT_0043179881 /DNA_START=108 /DNA_END=1718 /DNA_ORIENTATION=+